MSNAGVVHEDIVTGKGGRIEGLQSCVPCVDAEALALESLRGDHGGTGLRASAKVCAEVNGCSF